MYRYIDIYIDIYIEIYIQGESKKVGSQKNSNCAKSLNFEAKINCNTTK